MSDKISSLPVPSAVTRIITHRVLAHFNATGEFYVTNYNNTVTIGSRVTLAAGETIDVTFDAKDTARNIAVYVQPSGWSTECVAESSAVLGNVDFAFLADTGYQAYPQDQRSNRIALSFAADGAGAATILMKVMDDATKGSTHIYSFGTGQDDQGRTKPDAYVVAFVGFVEVAPNRKPAEPQQVAELGFTASPAQLLPAELGTVITFG